MNFQLTCNGSKNGELPECSPYQSNLIGTNRVFYFAERIAGYNNIADGKVKAFDNYCLTNSQRHYSKASKLTSQQSSELKGNVYSPEEPSSAGLDLLMKSAVQTTGHAKTGGITSMSRFLASKPHTQLRDQFLCHTMAMTSGQNAGTSEQHNYRRKQQSSLTRPTSCVSPFNVQAEADTVQISREPLPRRAVEEHAARAQNLISGIKIKSLAPSPFDLEGSEKVTPNASESRAKGGLSEGARLSGGKRRKNKKWSQKMLAKTKFIEDELSRTPENQVINLNKLRHCQMSKRASLKAAMRAFIADCLNKDQTFQQIKQYQSSRKNQIDIQFEQRFEGIEERLNNLSKKQSKKYKLRHIKRRNQYKSNYQYQQYHTQEMSRPQIGQFTTNSNQSEYVKNSFTTQSHAEQMAMAGNMNDIGIFHPHVNNQQAPCIHPNESLYKDSYQSKGGSDGGFTGNKQSMWTPDEDTTLVRLVEKIGPQKWALIADYLPNRQGKHCRERWHNHLNPRNKRCEWTKIEEWVLFLLHRKLDNQWAQIAKVLEGRTDNSIKNHWNSSMRKKKTDMQRALDSYINQMLKVRKVQVDKLDEKQLKQKQEEIENKYLLELRREVSIENKQYYEQKAKEMMRRQDGSIFVQICTRLLVQSVPELKEEELLEMVKLEQHQGSTMYNKDDKNSKKDSFMCSESFDTKFKNSIQNRLDENEKEPQDNAANAKTELAQKQSIEAEINEGKQLDLQKGHKRDSAEKEEDDDGDNNENACSLMQSKRLNKYNSKSNYFSQVMSKDNEFESNMKKPKISEDIQTGSTYPYSNNKENMDSMRQFQNMNEQALMDITGHANLGTSQQEKEEDVYKTPEQTVKQVKTVASLYRDSRQESPDQGNRGGHISSDDQERNAKRSEGTYYINNITNNIIVDKKLKEQRNAQLLQSSSNGKNYRTEETTEKKCTCHLKYLEKSDPRYPSSLPKSFPSFPGMPNLQHFPPYFLQMMEWYHMEMMKQYQANGRGFPHPDPAQRNRNARPGQAGCACPADGQQNHQECNCPLKHGSFHMPPPPSSFGWSFMPGMHKYAAHEPTSHDHQGSDKHNFEKLSFVSPLQTSKKKWRDYDCHAAGEHRADTSAPRPFNLQSSSKKQPMELIRQFNCQNKENQHKTAAYDDQSRPQKMMQLGSHRRGSSSHFPNQSNSKGTTVHAPTPAFSAAFKSPELDLSAKQPLSSLNKLPQCSINKFESLSTFREKAALKQGSQGSEIHQIDSNQASQGPAGQAKTIDAHVLADEEL